MTALSINTDQFREILNLKLGSYHPLRTFVTKDQFISILKNFRIEKNKFFPLPIYLDLSKEDKITLQKNKIIRLKYKNSIIGYIKNYSFYSIDKKKKLKSFFGTKSKKHIGVLNFLNSKKFFLSGKIILSKNIKINKKNYPNYWKNFFKKKKIKTIAGFHTRNIPHRTHEWIQNYALKKCKALFIHPMTGALKRGDFKRSVLIKSYLLFLKHIKNENIFFSQFVTYARYAGPREALFHALVRRNFGCTHFCLGRDHAGVGKYYKKYQSQKLCKKMEKKLGIKIITFKEPAYCKKCLKVTGENDNCRHSNKFREFISGTKIRNLLYKKKKIPERYVRKEISKYLNIKSLR